MSMPTGFIAMMLAGFQELALDFVADNLGLTLFHCHQQLHMDFVTSFGGPIAHIGYFREELIVRRRWVDDMTYTEAAEQLLDAVRTYLK
jgi:hypothetical protein